MKIIIDTETEKKEQKRKQREEALREQNLENLEIVCDPVFLIPTTILLFLIFWFGSPIGDVCRQALASGS